MTKDKKRLVRRILLASVLLLAALFFSGCETMKFYRQAIRGQYQIFAHQKPLEQVIADPNTSPELKGKLQLVQDLRAFASKQLHLPVDGHYHKYVDVHRRFVVWNVEAAPEFSMEPKSWWYPLVGSLNYRGYFFEDLATNYAGKLERKG